MGRSGLTATPPLSNAPHSMMSGCLQKKQRLRILSAVSAFLAFLRISFFDGYLLLRPAIRKQFLSGSLRIFLVEHFQKNRGQNRADDDQQDNGCKIGTGHKACLQPALCNN